MSSLNNLTLKKAISLLKNKEIQPSDIVNHYSEKIKADQKEDKSINAVIHFDEKKILEASNNVDLSSLLAGHPF